MGNGYYDEYGNWVKPKDKPCPECSRWSAWEQRGRICSTCNGTRRVPA